jgi:serine phosphatase RsbU (regulator of sigma subunit)
LTLHKQDLLVLEQLQTGFELLMQGKYPEQIPAEECSKPLAQVVLCFNRLAGQMKELYEYTVPLARGILNIERPGKMNFLAAGIKELHSKLNHLTWQAQQIAKGDYEQRIDFMGEFSLAFNSMVIKLDERERRLKEEILIRQKAEQEVRLQNKLMTDNIRYAGSIQRGFLPSDLDNAFLTISNIYQPHEHVGGDIFDYLWNEQTQTLSGYVADIMGHGVGTALQAMALRVLFRQAKEKRLSSGDTLRWINSKVSPYVAEDTFAAAIYFQIDFKRQVLSFAVAGINHLFAWTAQQTGLISKPGIFLGLLPDPEYEEHEIAFQSGDVFLFLTDGLFDLIADRKAFAVTTPDSTWSFLHALVAEHKGTDDASALKIVIK